MQKHIKRVGGGLTAIVAFGTVLLMTDIPKALEQADKSLGFIIKSLGYTKAPDHLVTMAWQHLWVVFLVFAIVFAFGVASSRSIESAWSKFRDRLAPSPVTARHGAQLSHILPASTAPSINQNTVVPDIALIKARLSMPTGRFVVQGVRVEEDGKDDKSFGVIVAVKNTGPGIAYAGTAITNYAFYEPGPLPSNLENTFENLLMQARKVHPKREVQQEGGTEFSFPVSIRLPKDFVGEMIAGKRGMAVWVLYAFYTEETPQHNIEIASLLLVYSGLGYRSVARVHRAPVHQNVQAITVTSDSKAYCQAVPPLGKAKVVPQPISVDRAAGWSRWRQ